MLRILVTIHDWRMRPLTFAAPMTILLTQFHIVEVQLSVLFAEFESLGRQIAKGIGCMGKPCIKLDQPCTATTEGAAWSSQTGILIHGRHLATVFFSHSGGKIGEFAQARFLSCRSLWLSWKAVRALAVSGHSHTVTGQRQYIDAILWLTFLKPSRCSMETT